MMKKIIKIVSVLAVFCVLFCSCGKDTADIDAPDGFKLASGEEADYIFYVPEEWKVETSSLYTSAYYDENGVKCSLSLTAYGMQFTDQTVEDWWASYTEQFNEVFDEFEVVTENAVEMGGVEGKKYEYTATLAEGKYSFLCAAVVKDQYVYYLTYTATPEQYETNLADVESAISYFEFK